MKTFFNTLFMSLMLALTLTSCRNSDDPIEQPNIETRDLIKIKEFSNSTHTIELYSKTGKLTQGYYDISLKIKNKTTGAYEKNAKVEWLPMMHMTTMSHSSPHSAQLTQEAGSAYYDGYIVFTMPQNDAEFWELKVDYSLNGVSYSATEKLDVQPTSKRNVNVFKGTDEVKYVLAFIEPQNPKIGSNDLKIGVWKMQDMMTFPVANGYSVKVDPRMPGMGNHSSPNNTPATQANIGEFYNGKVSFTMSGYWKLNLQFLASDHSVLKGDEVTDNVPYSSIFFEVEF